MVGRLVIALKADPLLRGRSTHLRSGTAVLKEVADSCPPEAGIDLRMKRMHSQRPLGQASLFSDEGLQGSEANEVAEGSLDVILVAVGRCQVQDRLVELERQRAHAGEPDWTEIESRNINLGFIDKPQR